MAIAINVLAARETCNYVAAGSYFQLQGSVDDAIEFSEAFENQISSAIDGETYVRVQRAVSNGDFDIWRVKYVSGSRLEKLGALPHTSSVSGGVAWGASDELEVMGVVKPSRIQELVRSRLLDSDDFLADEVGNDEALSIERTITPSDPETNLLVDYVTYAKVSGNSTSLRGRLSIQYKTGPSSWSDVGSLAIVGHENITKDNSSPAVSESAINRAQLTSSHLYNGDWVFRLSGRPFGSGVQIESLETLLDIEEILVIS